MSEVKINCALRINIFFSSAIYNRKCAYLNFVNSTAPQLASALRFLFCLWLLKNEEMVEFLLHIPKMQQTTKRPHFLLSSSLAPPPFPISLHQKEAWYAFDIEKKDKWGGGGWSQIIRQQKMWSLPIYSLMFLVILFPIDTVIKVYSHPKTDISIVLPCCILHITFLYLRREF